MDDFVYAETDPVELAAYRAEVEAWMNENMPRRDPVNPWHPTQDDDERSSRNRELQRRLSDGGYAAVCYPKEYGGQGLTAAHQKIIDDVSMDFDMPVLFSVPTLSICGPVILEFGTEAQKQRYIPAWIRGDELWVQFISEPSGGSDMAGALTRADRDGDTFVLNGSKIWSTFAQRSDYALLLARTNWDVPKHRGLTMFIVPIHHPGIEIHPIQMVDRTEEFCQEFFNDVVIPAENVVGEVNDGWTVASRLLFHERAAVGNASPYTQGRHRNRTADGVEDLAAIARDHGGADVGHGDAEPGGGPAVGPGGEGHRGRLSARPGRVAGAPVPRLVPHRATYGGFGGARRPGPGVEPGRVHRRVWRGLCAAPASLHRRRHHRDGPQHHQRAHPRHAPRTRRRPRPPLQPSPPQRLARRGRRPSQGWLTRGFKITTL